MKNKYIEDVVIFIKRKGHGILQSRVPDNCSDPNSDNYAKALNDKLNTALKIVAKHKYFNRLDIFIPDRIEYYDEYLMKAFGNLSKKYGKRFIKKKMHFIMIRKHFQNKLFAMIFGNYESEKNYDKKK